VANQYLLGGDEELELNPDGQRKISDVLQQMDDESVEQGFAYWKGANLSRAKRTSTSTKDKQNISKWVDMNIDTGNIDVRALDTPTNCAMSAIWCLTTRLKVAKAVKPNVALTYLKTKYTTASVDQKAFTRALGRAKNGHRFAKTGEGLYYLTARAEREVESWLKDGVSKPGQAESADEKWCGVMSVARNNLEAALAQKIPRDILTRMLDEYQHIKQQFFYGSFNLVN
jgi:hypothetical protein